MKLKNFSGSLINVIVAIFLCAFTVSCGGGGGDDAGSVAGATGSISLTANVTSIPADGSSGATIRAYIIDSAGNPVRNFTDVTFTTTLGHFRNGSYSYTVQTQPPLKDGKPDIDAAPTGLVDAVLIAGIESGSAKVTVRSNNITQTIYITLTGGGAAISLVALPETIPADGASSTTITATVVNSSGTPVTPGTEVFFQTGFGTFSNGAKSYKAITPDATGIVTVSLLSGVVPGTTYIQASSGGVTQAISIVLTKIDPSYSKITVEANPARIAADGKSQSVITATITRTQNIANAGAGTSGQPIPDVPITFYKITSNAEPEPLPEANLYKGTGTSIKGPFYSYGGLIEFTMTAIPGTDSAPYFAVWLFNPLSGTRENLIDLSGDDFTCDYYSGGWHCETITKKVSKSPLPGNYQLEIQTNCRFEIKVDGDIGPAQTGKTVLAFQKTDTNGKAVYSYTADWLPGTFKIKGETGELSNPDPALNQALSQETSLTQTEGEPDLVEIKKPDIPLYANGESVITITALVWDPAGNKVPDGTDVYFSATKGYISPDAAVTVDGIASTTLTTIASATSIFSEVTARYGTYSDSVDVTFIGVSLSDMRAEPTSIFANGVDKSTISVQLKNDFGITVENETVSFSTTNGGLSSSTGTTDTEGLATVQLTAPIVPGTAVVTAQYGLGSPVSVAVAFASAPVVGSIVLSANPETIPADGVSSSTITVTIRDSASAPVPKGTSVTLTTTLGTFLNSGSSYTAITPNETGVVSVPLKAGFTGGSAVVTASSHSVTQSIVVPFTTSIVASINLLASPETIPADGFSSSIITATIKDGASGPAPTGTSITFTTTLGTFPNSGSSYTVITPDASGVVSVPLKAGFIGGSAIITASSENVFQSVVVLFTSSVVTSVNLSATPYTIKADGTSTSEIRATVSDSNGNPVADGEQVSFVITSGLGTLGGSLVGTVGGIATVTYTAPNTAGTAVIQAMTTNGVSDTVTITLSNPTMGTIVLGAEPAEIPADGSSSTTITATVLNSTGNPVVEGTNVTFTTNLGTFSNGSSTYSISTEGDSGVVQVALMAGVTPGYAMVKAESEGVSNMVRVTIGHAGNTGVPVAEEFSLSSWYLNVTGLWIASLVDQVTASVGDVYGNAVQDNTLIFFKTYNTGGFFDKDQDATLSGFASSTLYTTGGPTPLQGFAFMTSETDGGPTTRVSAFGVTPYPDNHIVYAGTNGGGVYKSTNYGATWETVSRSTENQKQGQNVIDPYVKGHSAISVDPDDHNTVYVGTGYLGQGNVFRSLDGGLNWNSNNVEEWNGLFETNAAVLSVLCDGGNSPYVWIGTEGRGPLFATDGKTFQPSNGIASNPQFSGAGNGTMSQPVLWYSSQSETWTAACVVVNGAVSTPVFTGEGDGYMTGVTTGSTAKTEDWTVSYKSVPGTPTFTGTGNGSLRNILLTQPNAASETWTLGCVSVAGAISAVTGTATGKGGIVSGIAVDSSHTEEETFTLTCIDSTVGSEEFEVTSSLGGNYPDAKVGSSYNQNGLQFTISAADGATPYVVEDTYVFTYSPGATTFSVQSSVAGFYPEATVGTTYNQDGLSFLINQGTTPFEVGDRFTFTTTSGWRVTGTVSGIQTNTAETGSAYTSDNNEIGFTIVAGGVPFEVGDQFIFSTIEGTTFWNVSGTASGMQSKRAFNDRFYISDNLEVRFTISEGSTPFVSGDTFTFTVTESSLGHGWNVWDIVKVPNTHGSTAVLYAGTSTGVHKTTNGAQTWSSLSSFTGDFITALALYPTATGGSGDILYAGAQNAGVWVSANSGFSWTQYTGGMDLGISATIKDLLVDPTNKKLYALTYKGPINAAAGKVYVHDLNIDGTMTAGNWKDVSSGLSGTALFALAAARPSDPTTLFAGGEGINLYTAAAGLDTGIPEWVDSKTGIGNLIMSRAAILFSGRSTMTVLPVFLGGDRYYFEVYIEDINGNPPIMGSTFTAITYNATGGKIENIFTKTYGDSYVNEGTYRDPSDPATNNPISTPVVDFSGASAKVEFTFTPTCCPSENPACFRDEESVPGPGCSGSTQISAYAF